MKSIDILRFAFHSIERSPARTGLTLLAMAIGVASVVMLTGLGEAARRYISNEFVSLGTNLVIVLPGKSETVSGSISASIGSTTRPLTIEDAAALTQHHSVKRVSPLVVGAASVQYAGLETETVVYGTTSEMKSIRQWRISQGVFLSDGDWQKGSQVCVIGANIATDMFTGEVAVGRWLRIGESRFRVIGVLGTVGSAMGMDVGDAVIVPVGSAMKLFNTDNVFRIMVESVSAETINAVSDFVLRTITSRHKGHEDVTVITQDAVLKTFNQIFSALTLTVGGIGAISLAVAGVLIMNVMLVSVTQRTQEVGLLKAVGAASGQITLLFLTEAALLSLLGAAVGLGLGLFGAWMVSSLFPMLDMRPPNWSIVAAVLVALLTGILFGLVPARRAARLDPIIALATR